jgi:hypothetical protein
MKQLRTAAVPSILLRWTHHLAQGVRLSVSFHLHYFSAPAEHLLRKELSEIFAPIPGGGHGTTAFRSVLVALMLAKHAATIINALDLTVHRG